MNFSEELRISFFLMFFISYKITLIKLVYFSMMSQNPNQLHQQHMNAARLNTTADTTVSMQDDSDEMQEVIQVQILPQVGFCFRTFDGYP